MRGVVAIAAILTGVLGGSLEDNGTVGVGVPNADIVTIIHEMQKEIEVFKQRDEDMAKEINVLKQGEDSAKIKIRDLTNEIGFIKAKMLTAGKTLLQSYLYGGELK